MKQKNRVIFIITQEENGLTHYIVAEGQGMQKSVAQVKKSIFNQAKALAEENAQGHDKRGPKSPSDLLAEVEFTFDEWPNELLEFFEAHLEATVDIVADIQKDVIGFLAENKHLPWGVRAGLTSEFSQDEALKEVPQDLKAETANNLLAELYPAESPSDLETLEAEQAFSDSMMEPKAYEAKKAANAESIARVLKKIGMQPPKDNK